ncbi:uncharacterized protein [Diabrotica undecimpunctata]|uniref:uncharacterized protein n=1 Tax=Diabrotica undecimpunctata TaxID=50387 RepID=UPI003B639ED1
MPRAGYNKWRVTINPPKTQTILFKTSNCRDAQGRTQTLLGEDLIFTNSVSYLGVRFTRTLNWKTGVQESLDRMRKRFNLLKVLTGKISGTSSKTLLHTYKTFVRPIVKYKACVYIFLKPHQLNAIIATERRILRYCMRKDWSYPSAHIYILANITPIKDRILSLSRKYILRTIANMETNTKDAMQPPRANTHQASHKKSSVSSSKTSPQHWT